MCVQVVVQQSVCQMEFVVDIQVFEDVLDAGVAGGEDVGGKMDGGFEGGERVEEERRPRGKGKEEHAECGADSAREFRGEGRHEAARRGVRSARSGDVAVEGAERSAAKVVATVARARRERRREGGR